MVVVGSVCGRLADGGVCVWDTEWCLFEHACEILGGVCVCVFQRYRAWLCVGVCLILDGGNTEISIGDMLSGGGGDHLTPQDIKTSASPPLAEQRTSE